jgi:hypothetical protein
VHSWEWRYYNNLLKKSEYSVDHEKIKEYFPLETVVKGMFEVFGEVLGARFVPAALPAWWLHRFDDYQTRGLAQPAVSLGAAGLVGVMLALLLVSVAGSLLAGRSGSRLKPLPREDASKLT